MSNGVPDAELDNGRGSARTACTLIMSAGKFLVPMVGEVSVAPSSSLLRVAVEAH